MNHAQRFRTLTSTDGVRENLRTSSVRAALFTGAAGFTDFALRIGSTAVLARLILPEHFGLVMMVTAVTAIADQLRDLGLSAATVQEREITHEQVTNLFWLNVAMSTGLAILLCAIAPLLAAYYRDPRLAVITCVLAATMVLGGIGIQHQALLTRQLRLGQTSSLRLITSIVSTLLAVVLAWRGAGYWALLAREVARAAMLSAGMWWLFPWVPGRPTRGAGVGALVRFGANLTGANLLATLSAGIDRFLIGRLWGAGPVAMYRQAYQLISAPTDQLLSPLYQVTQPSLSMLQAEPARFRRFYRRVLTLVCIATMPLSLFVAVYAVEVTTLLLGNRWVAAAPILCILSFGTFIRQAAGSTAFVAIARGQAAPYLHLTLLQNVTLLVLMFASVWWGIEAVALADVVATYLLVAPRLQVCLQGSAVTPREFLHVIARPAVASIAMGLVLLALPSASAAAVGPFHHLAVSAVIAVAVFGAAWLLIPGGTSEFQRIVDDVRAVRQRQPLVTKPAPTVAAAS